VIDGAAWPVLGVLNYRWYEVAKYLLRPAFGNLVHPIFINLNTWNRLAEQQKQLMLSEGRKIEDMWYEEWIKLSDEEHRKLLESGAQVTPIGEAQRSKVNKALADTLFQLGMQYNPKDVGEIREFGKAKHLY
jgi:TRAP-type C4-dicarboxylate transport system substrate-binding protein